MPSTSKKQARFMAMIAHDKGAAKRTGVPQSAGVQQGRRQDRDPSEEREEMTPEEELKSDSAIALLQRCARELTTIRQLCTTAVTYIRDAESEIPEKYRRFVNAFHDVHHIGWVYEEKGHPIPDHVLRELERLDDRYRQIISTLNAEDGTFGKVRREMASDPLNRWDHTRQLAAPTHTKEKPNEARISEQVRPSEPEARAAGNGSEPKGS